MSTIDHDTLQRATKAAKNRFGALCSEFPKLKGYLMFAISGQQTGIGSSPDTILGELPLMVVENSASEALRRHLKKPPEKDAKEEVEKAWEEKLKRLGVELNYYDHIQIEVRFNNLDYALIDKIRPHPLVDQRLTPQTRASIRIVLGTLEEFATADANRLK